MRGKRLAAFAQYKFPKKQGILAVAFDLAMSALIISALNYALTINRRIFNRVLYYLLAASGSAVPRCSAAALPIFIDASSESNPPPLPAGGRLSLSLP